MSGRSAEVTQWAETESRDYGTALEGAGIPAALLRDLTAETATSGAEMVPTELRGIIDIFREKLMVRQMGATVFSGLTGNVDFPKFSDTSAPTEQGETAAADELSPATSKMTLSPERLPVVAEITKQLLRQQGPDVEAWLRNFLAFRIASRMDAMAINGSGSSNQPEGVLNASGTGDVNIGTNGGALTWPLVLEFFSNVDTADADQGRLGFLTTPGVKYHLMQVEKASNTAQFVLMDPGESLLGVPFRTSTNVPSTLTKGTLSGTGHAAIYGNWSDLYVGQWGGIDVLVNPYSKDDTGIVRINVDTFYDVAVARAASFSICDEIDISSQPTPPKGATPMALTAKGWLPPPSQKMRIEITAPTRIKGIGGVEKGQIVESEDPAEAAELEKTVFEGKARALPDDEPKKPVAKKKAAKKKAAAPADSKG